MFDSKSQLTESSNKSSYKNLFKKKYWILTLIEFKIFVIINHSYFFESIFMINRDIM